jgi:uncharacterized protein involved in exopolysaccharide biosynthesis
MTFASPGVPAPAEPFKKPIPYDADDDEIDLAAQVRTLWAYRRIIVATAVVCAAIAAGFALTRSRTYEATAAVVLNQSKLGDRVDVVAASVATFQPLLQSRSIAASVIQEFGLDKAPRNVSVTQFFDDVVTVEPVRNSTVFLLKIVLDDPILAARVVNRVADKAIDMSRQVSQQEASRSRDDLQQQRDDARTRMEQAGEALRKFRETSQLELLRKDVDAMLGQRGELLGLLIQIETEKARLARAEQELAGRQRIGTVKRSIDSDPAMMESARKTGESSGSLLSLETRNEFVNGVYETLDTQVASSRTTLAALERRKAQVVDVRKLGASQLTQLTRLYQLENDQARLEMERDLATGVYRQVATAYETARVQVASRSAQLAILDPAVAPDRPASRHVARNTLIGLIAGLIFASIGAAIHSNMTVTDQSRNQPARRNV